ncbi:MAG: PEP-CTERM sorting domain-containing protein [Candidatus Brocadiia bacterium]
MMGTTPPDPWASDWNYGDIQYYTIEYDPFIVGYELYFDVVGLAQGSPELWRFAPFSHNARSVALPEPATAVLLLTGRAGLAAYKRRRRRPRALREIPAFLSLTPPSAYRPKGSPASPWPCVQSVQRFA